MATEDDTHPGPSADKPPRTAPTESHHPVEQNRAREWLRDADTGRWQVSTRTAIYILDMDARTTLRIPGASHEHGLNRSAMEVFVVRSLPGDLQPQHLLQLLECRVGLPMRLRRLRDCGGISTSTPVLTIRPLRQPGHQGVEQ
jgi:hypothetical protein